MTAAWQEEMLKNLGERYIACEEELQQTQAENTRLKATNIGLRAERKQLAVEEEEQARLTDKAQTENKRLQADLILARDQAALACMLGVKTNF